jgi:uncharacterized membrane protein
MGLSILILGMIVLLAPHVFTTMRERRRQAIDRLGEIPYKTLYSLVSLAGLVLIVYGFTLYRISGWIDIWYPPAWTRHLVALLMWPASVMLVAAYIPGRIKVALKHPFLAGIKLWALAHLIANGDLGSIVLFGSILGYAVYDRITLKHRTDPGGPPIPVGGVRNDAIAVVVGTGLFVLVGWLFHPYAIGVRAF